MYFSLEHVYQNRPICYQFPNNIAQYQECRK